MRGEVIFDSDLVKMDGLGIHEDCIVILTAYLGMRERCVCEKLNSYIGTVQSRVVRSTPILRRNL